MRAGGVPALRAVDHGAQAARPDPRPEHAERPRPGRRLGHDRDGHADAGHWVLPPTGAGNTATATTDACGFAQFQWTTTVPGDSTFQISEEDPAGVPPGFVNDPSATQCTFRTPEHPGDQPLPVNADRTGVFRDGLRPRRSPPARWSTARRPRPQIEIEKSTNGADADDPPGPSIPVTDANGNPTPVTWTYVVTNTGNVTLSSIARHRRPARRDGQLPRRQPGPRDEQDLHRHRHGRSGARTRTSARSPPPTRSVRTSPTPTPRTTSGPPRGSTSRSRPTAPTPTTRPGRSSRSATRSPGPTSSPTPATRRSPASRSPTTRA